MFETFSVEKGDVGGGGGCMGTNVYLVVVVLGVGTEASDEEES